MKAVIWRRPAAGHPVWDPYITVYNALWRCRAVRDGRGDVGGILDMGSPGSDFRKWWGKNEKPMRNHEKPMRNHSGVCLIDMRRGRQSASDAVVKALATRSSKR